MRLAAQEEVCHNLALRNALNFSAVWLRIRIIDSGYHGDSKIRNLRNEKRAHQTIMDSDFDSL